MPTSALQVWPKVIHLVWQVQPSTILDVGPGHGKAAILLREYVGTMARDLGAIERIDAVEAEPRYLVMFPWLSAVYDSVISANVADMTEAELDAYDLVLMVDVIEHLDKADALALIDRIRGHVVICTPIAFFDNPEADEGWESERHRSHWVAADWEMDRTIHVDKDVELGGWIVALGPKGGA